MRTTQASDVNRELDAPAAEAVREEVAVEGEAAVAEAMEAALKQTRH
jgi:hypothetical protein